MKSFVMFWKSLFSKIFRSESKSLFPLDSLPDGYFCPMRKAVLYRSGSDSDYTMYEWVDPSSRRVVELSYTFGPSMNKQSEVKLLLDRVAALESKIQDLRGETVLPIRGSRSSVAIVGDAKKRVQKRP